MRIDSRAPLPLRRQSPLSRRTSSARSSSLSVRPVSSSSGRSSPPTLSPSDFEEWLRESSALRTSLRTPWITAERVAAWSAESNWRWVYGCWAIVFHGVFIPPIGLMSTSFGLFVFQSEKELSADRRLFLLQSRWTDGLRRPESAVSSPPTAFSRRPRRGCRGHRSSRRERQDLHMPDPSESQDDLDRKKGKSVSSIRVNKRIGRSRRLRLPRHVVHQHWRTRVGPVVARQGCLGPL